MSIDDRLRDITSKAMHYGGLRVSRGNDPKYVPDPREVEEDLIAQIKQAFKDEGYYQTPLKADTKSIYAPTIADEHRTFMTGQEWYNRFEKELYKPKEQEYNLGTFTDDKKKARFYRDGGTNFMYVRALEAAKRASGLENKTWTDEQGNKHSFNNGTETINYKGWEEIEDQKAQEDK